MLAVYWGNLNSPTELLIRVCLAGYFIWRSASSPSFPWILQMVCCSWSLPFTLNFSFRTDFGSSSRRCWTELPGIHSCSLSMTSLFSKRILIHAYINFCNSLHGYEIHGRISGHWLNLHPSTQRSKRLKATFGVLWACCGQSHFALG